MKPLADEKSRTRIIKEAADWLARMHGDTWCDADKQAWQHWLQQSTEHQYVWQQAQQLSRQLGAVEPALGMSVLNRSRRGLSRRQVISSLAVVATLPAAAWWGVQLFQNQGRDFYRTATGERRDLVLADGSSLTLNTASRLKVMFDAQRRLLKHLEGEIWIQTAPDASQRPFLVATEHGQLRALGTRFLVKTEAESTRLSVLESAVEITARHGVSRIIEAGQQVNFTALTIGENTPLATGSDAWRKGVLYAQQMRLADFIAEVSRYRTGFLRCDPAVADVPVSGTFQLADTDNILQLLAETLPVSIQQRSRYWVTVIPR